MYHHMCQEGSCHVPSSVALGTVSCSPNVKLINEIHFLAEILNSNVSTSTATCKLRYPYLLGDALVCLLEHEV